MELTERAKDSPGVLEEQLSKIQYLETQVVQLNQRIARLEQPQYAYNNNTGPWTTTTMGYDTPDVLKSDVPRPTKWNGTTFC